MRRRAAPLCALASIVALLGPVSAAAAGPTFALKPATETQLGYFVLSGKPGATLRGKFEVLNVGTKVGRTSLYTVDATTGETSGAVYRSKGEPRRDVGGWIKLAKNTMELAPGESQVVPFTVHVPEEASPGQHLGGIVAQRSNEMAGNQPAPKEKNKKNGFKVKIQALSVLAVQVNVPGPEQARMTLSGIKPGDQPGHQSLLLGIGNSGNVLVKGTGSLKVVNHAGRQVQNQQFNLDTFVPDTQIQFPVYVQGKALRAGRYRGTVTIAYRGHTLTRTFPFTVSAAQVKQVFGSTASQNTPSDSGPSDSTLIAILAGVSAVSIGAAGFFYMRTRSPA